MGIKHSEQMMRRRNKGKYGGRKRILDDAKLYKLHKGGMSNWEISKIMDCSLETVERHLRKIEGE